jgi:hypothetical protein
MDVRELWWAIVQVGIHNVVDEALKFNADSVRGSFP